MSEVRVHVVFTPKEDKREAFLSAMSKIVEETNREEGCKFFQLFSQENKGVPNEKQGDGKSFLLLELWRDQAALAAHMQEPHTKGFIKAWNEELKEKELEIQFFKPAATK